MAFGIEIYNNSGEVVMNSEDQLIQLSRELTSSGTLTNTYYKHTISRTHPSNFLFFKLGVGDSVAVDYRVQSDFFSNKASIEVREGSFAGNLTPGSGYGMNVYNQAGELVWTFNKSVIAARRWFNVPGSDNSIPTVTFNCDEQWFALARPAFATAWTGESIGIEYARGVKRISSTQIETEGFPVRSNQIQNAVFSTDYMIITAD